MKINKTQNAAKGILFGSILKIYQILVPFAFRTIMIRTIGIQYLGLNSLFASILQVLNLAELGVGSAMVFSMYKPIAEDDTEHINALMRLYKLYYRAIGLIILLIGLLCTPFVPNLIHGNIPSDMNVYILYLLNLGVTVLTYWLFAYKNSILLAYQRKDVISIVHLGTYTFKYVAQIISLVCFRSYYLYVIMRIISQIMTNIVTAIASHRLYPQYRASGKLAKDEIKTINRRVRDLFTSKLGGVIIHSADTIVISAFLGLEVLALYQNYYYIISSVMAFITIINSSVIAGVGNSLIIKSETENYQEFRVFSFLQFWIIGFCVCCFTTLFQPFMTIWMGKDKLLQFPIVIFMSIIFFGDRVVQIMSVYKDAAGIWNKDRFRPLISAIVNLVLNLIMVQKWGLYGVVISTVISVFFISIPWIISNIFKYLFVHQAIKEYIKDIMIWTVIIVFIAGINLLVCSLITGTGIIYFLIKIIICLLLPNAFIFMFFHNRNECKKVLQLSKKVVHRK